MFKKFILLISIFCVQIYATPSKNTMSSKPNEDVLVYKMVYGDYDFIDDKNDLKLSIQGVLNQMYFNYVLEWDNMQKRMGELRDDSGVGGFWFRVFGGESSYFDKNVIKYQKAQFGVDKRTEYFGVTNYTGLVFALYRFDTNFYDIAYNKAKSYSVGIYSGFLYDNGFYLDMMAKYIAYKNDLSFKINRSNATQMTLNSKDILRNFIASVGLGYRGYFYKNYFAEPYLEFISGYINSFELSSKKENINLKANSFTPFSLKSMIFLGKSSDKYDVFGFKFGLGLAIDLVDNGDKVIKYDDIDRKINGTKDTRVLLNTAINYNLPYNIKLNLGFDRSFLGDINQEQEINFTVRKSF